jgi:carbon monoxide dehydrogenase subunit G
MIVPAPPTATNCVPDQATPWKSLTTENEALEATVPTLIGPVKLAIDGTVKTI